MAWVVVGATAAAVGTGASLYGLSQAEKGSKAQKKALKAQGKEQQKAKYFAAKQMEQGAVQEEALGTINAEEELRKSELLASRALALAGASGAGLNDPGYLSIVGDIASKGRLAAETQLYNAGEAARSLRVGAKVARWEGDMARKGLNVEAGALKYAVEQKRAQTVVDIASTVTNFAGALR